MKGLFRRVDQFWTSGIDDRVYGCVRLSFAVVAFLNVLHWWGSSDELLSSAGFNSFASAAESSPWSALSLFACVRDPLLIKGALVFFAVVHVFLFFGFFVRASLLLSFYWHFSYFNWAVLGTAGWDMILGNVSFVLLLSPEGRSVRPLDWLRCLFAERRWSWYRGGELSMSPRYGIVLLRIQVFLIYWLAVVTRLPDPYWRNGDFFGYYLLSDFCWFGGPWVLEAGWLIKTATWATQAIETLVPLLLVFRRTWVAGFAVGALFHLGIAITTPNLALFSLAMVMMYASFARFPNGERMAQARPARG